MSVPWTLNQVNKVTFVMVDTTGNELTGRTLSIEVSKNGGAFAAAAGSWGEIGSGWYWYQATAGEADTVGPLSIRINASGAAQQNLEYGVVSRTSSAVYYTYEVLVNGTGDPIQGAIVEIAPTSDRNTVIYVCVTDAFGVARDSYGNLPLLDPGTYYFWTRHDDYTFNNPDAEAVS